MDVTASGQQRWRATITQRWPMMAVINGDLVVVVVVNQPAPGISSFTVALHRYDMQQKDDILAGLPVGPRQGLIVRASVSSGDGAILEYPSEVDNTTNSGCYQKSFRFGY